jgi:hypothetical protein
MDAFARAADGQLVFTLFEGNAEVLELLMRELAMFLRSPEPDTRATDRLFPRAYLDPTEDTSEREWQALVHDDLVRNKLTAFDGVAGWLAGATAGADGLVRLTLTAAQEGELLLAVNDARLTLAAMAGEDPEPSMLSDWLLDLVAELSELQLSELPEVAGDDGEQPPDALPD